MADWMTSSQIKTIFENAGLVDDALVKFVSWACLSRQLIATGFRQIDILNAGGVIAGLDRQNVNSSYIWRYFRRAFSDGSGFFGETSTMLESDWENGSFRYRIEFSPPSEYAHANVECWLNWKKSQASYTVECGDQCIQEVWTSILFDAPMAQVLSKNLNVRTTVKKGRPPKYEWDIFESEAKRIIWDEGGFHETFSQANCEAMMADWCNYNWNKIPVESSIRQHVKQAFKSFEAEKARA